MSIDDMTTDDLIQQIRESSVVKDRDPFTVNQPFSVTKRFFPYGGDRGEEYRKDHFVGDEKLLLVDAYFGKRNQLIFRFVPQKSIPPEDLNSAYECYEFKLKEAQDFLAGFTDWSETFFNDSFDKALAKIRRQTKRVEQEREKEVMVGRYERLNHYGSW